LKIIQKARKSCYIKEMIKADYAGNYADLPHILVVDDDDRIRNLVSRYLNENGFLALSAENGAQARSVLKYFSFDALVLDVMMPGETGLDLSASLRKISDIPILFLTALGDVEDKLKGFESGGDDYLPKPFDPRELVFRLQSLLRRSERQKQKEPSKTYYIGPWTFDTTLGQLNNLESQENIQLTDVEAALLRALCTRPGEILSREALYELSALSSKEAYTNERTIDVQITRLRKKLGEDSKKPKFLQTVRGKGYILHVKDGA
jgi:two-component system phosphate regulon response regulator OmpR